MARQEPGWLTATYTVVGLAIIAAVLWLVFAVATYWYLFLAVGLAGFGLWFYTRSPAAKERKASEATASLFRKMADIDTSAFPTPEDFGTDAGALLIDADIPKPPKAILRAMMRVAKELYRAEGFTSVLIDQPPTRLDTVEGARYRRELQRIHRKLSNPEAFEAVHVTLHRTFGDLIQSIPPALLRSHDVLIKEIDDTSSAPLFTVPLAQMLPDLGQRVEDLILPFYAAATRNAEVFTALREQLDRNLDEASGIAQGKDKARIMPSKYDADDVVSAYLHDTILEDIFDTPVPFPLPLEARFEHMHIVAGSGHGKTQTLQHLIVNDLSQPVPPGLVVIDSQGDMIRKLSRLALFDPEGGALASRIIVIDPADIENPPALNMFDVNFNRLGHYNQAAREQILNGVIELYDYMFGSLLDAELTSKQSVIFRYIARLMLAIPGATIHDLLSLLTDATPYMQYVAQLPPGARLFFETEFPQKSFAETKKQIQRRLWGILENPTLERMLTAPKNRIDMFDALNSGKIVLVNTAKDFLKPERSSFLGRLFIALTLQAALERAALAEDQRRPAFLYIDEAADYFDDNIDDLLTQARKYKLGVVFSHQYLDQLAPALHSSIAANTSIKFAGGVSDRDARSIAPDMRTTPTFLLAQHKQPEATQFACYLRNITPTALSLTIPFGSLESQPKMSDHAFHRMQDLNAARVSGRPSASPAVSSAVPAPDPLSKVQGGPDTVQATNGEIASNQRRDAAAAPSESVPFLLTSAQKARLFDLGISHEQIRAMTPLDAQRILEERPQPEPPSKHPADNEADWSS